VYPSSLIETSRGHVKVIAGDAREVRRSAGKQLVVVGLLCLVISSLANQAVARWLGISRIAPWTRAEAAYRRIGPQSGPQVFCAGSSLLVSGLAWPEVSESLGQGIENWTVAGSSPEVWEVFQRQKRVSDTTLIGVSVYDLNEMRLTPERANFVPISTTAADLWSSRADSDLTQRILAQYALSYLRILYPMAGDADKALVALRAKAADVLGQDSKLQQHEGVVVEKNGVLDVEEGMGALSDWSSARVVRRLEALRAENHDAHKFFNGPKTQALRRVLLRARQQGRVLVVVLPVSQYYADAFLDINSIAAFEKALAEDMSAAPEATLVRLDRVPGLPDNTHFFDLVHLNSSGRRLATEVFLKKVNEGASTANAKLATRVNPAKQ
jgi:hypothetical protein